MTFHSIANKFLALLIVCLVSLKVHADDFPERSLPPRLVNDYADFLSAGEEDALEQKLKLYDDSTSTQIAIVTMKSIGDYQASDYAQQLAQKWGVGQKGKDNGLLILVVKEPHDFFLATGYGMEGSLPDSRVKRLFEEIVKPNFKANQYYTGLDQLTDAIIQIMGGEYVQDGKKGKGIGNRTIWIFFALFILIAVLSALSKRGGGGNGYGGGGGGGFLTGVLLGNLASGGFSSRGGYSGGSGGGFGGFGGGSFGGGGAGGSW